VQTYSAPRTEQNGYELIALAKNFNNSLLLQALRMQYFQSRTLQTVSGIETPSLERDTLHDLQVVLQSVHQNSLDVKNLQLKNEKKQLKALSKNKALSAGEKQALKEQLSNNIRQTKKEINYLKQNAKQKIAATAQSYLDEMKATFLADGQVSRQAEQAPSAEIKANHKKPVAE
jgi:hypothetical protein